MDDNEVSLDELKGAVTALPTNEKMGELKEVVEKYLILTERIEKGNLLLETLNKEKSLLENETLPTILGAMGMSEFKTDTGVKIAVHPIYGCSVPDERKPEAWAWLRDNDFGSLIKNTIKVVFGKGEDEKAEKLTTDLLLARIPFELKEDVHASTLKATIKELYEKGIEFPESTFGAFTKKIAQIEKEKPKSKKR